ncbi:hypothetical protein [Winogradskyella poriferorum]|uniref:hypothetical protein n=1 Tax=Winogradskyella poriferorum TaxID=307627 RepID=UPI003D65B28C
MSSTFAEAYQKLEKSLHGFIPEDEPWFLPQLYQLIQDYGEKTALKYALASNWPIYHLELFIKSGLRQVDKSILLDYTNSPNEEDVYSAALCIAICGHQEGFEILEQFATYTHKLSKHIDPFTDVVPDLKFIEDPRAKQLKELCISYIPSISHALNLNNELDILKALLPYLELKADIKSSEKEALLAFEAYNYDLVGLIGLLTDDLPRIILGKLGSNLIIKQKCKCIPHKISDLKNIANQYFEQPYTYAEDYVFSELMNTYSIDKIDDDGNILE